MKDQLTLPMWMIRGKCAWGPFTVGAHLVGEGTLAVLDRERKPVCIMPDQTGPCLAQAEMIAHSLHNLPLLMEAVREFLDGEPGSQDRLKAMYKMSQNVVCFP